MMNRRATLTGLLACTLVFLFAGGAMADTKVNVCHVPPGNPANFHTITISESALQAHLGHGDLAGECSAHCAQLCNDGNACTVDACDASGRCAADHPPVSCDDGNLCTTDSCDPVTGCSGTPRTCVDSNLCTVNSCDPLTGDCVFPAVVCDPGETCNPANGTCEPNGVDECESNPCFRGDCIDQNNGFFCQCPPGYTGTFCEREIDECVSQPCVNGECFDGVNQYTCQCQPGWTGTNCDQPESQQTYNCTDRNPCTPENIGNGQFYFAADDPAQFIQCTQTGRCFEMYCPEGLIWNQALLTCIPG